MFSARTKMPVFDTIPLAMKRRYRIRVFLTFKLFRLSDRNAVFGQVAFQIGNFYLTEVKQ